MQRRILVLEDQENTKRPLQSLCEAESNITVDAVSDGPAAFSKSTTL